MVMLMIHMVQADITTQEFFEDVIFEQDVKTKKRAFSMLFLKSEDFFRVLQEKGIRSKNKEHPNLREFLQLNEQNPTLILVKNIKSTLEQMSENEQFMAAIQEDMEYEDDGQGQPYEEDEGKLETVGEGNETNLMTTGKQASAEAGANGSAGMAGLQDIGDFGNNDSDQDSNDGYANDDGFEDNEGEDYEF